MSATIVEDIVIPSGHTVRRIVKCPRKGTVSSCRLAQWDERDDLMQGFRFSFWSAREGCPPGCTPNDGPGSAPIDDWARFQYKLGEPVEVEAGKHEALAEDGSPDAEAGWEYRNFDNNGSQTNMLRQIYLELTDLGPVDPNVLRRYKLFMVIEPKSE